MSTNSSSNIKRTLKLPIDALKYAASEPFLTGPLLLALTKAPDHVRQAVLRPFQTNILAKNGSQRLAQIITTLKYLFVLGVASRLNQALEKLALNHWHLSRQGASWKFGGAGKTELVVITGGCSGFGYHMVKSFVGKARVIVLDVSDLPEELSKLPEVHYYKCDVTDFEGIVSVASSIRNRHGNPTVLINNAGIGQGKTILDTSPEWLEKVFRVNLISHWILIKEFLPGMLEARKGHIVTIASMASYTSVPGLVDYCATKAGALALHEGLRGELRDRYPNGECIQTTCVHPSWHRTGILGPFEAKLKEFGIRVDPPTEVSDRVVAQVLQGRSGQIFVPKEQIRGSYLRSWPQWLQDVAHGDVLSKKNRFQFSE